jgi:hypothetical protein
MIGRVGQCLTFAGMTRLYVTTPDMQQVVYTPAQAMPVPVPVQASSQTPMQAAPRQGWLHP